MRTVLLVWAVVVACRIDVLAQGVYQPRPAAAQPSTDGPLLGPPTVAVPNVPAPPAALLPSAPAAGAATPSAPSAAASGQGTVLKPFPRLLRRPTADGAETAPPSAERPTIPRWKPLFSRPTPPPAPAAETPPVNITLPETASSSAVAKFPPAPEAPQRRWLNSKKVGPVEVFPQPKDSDRIGNPLSIRRPILAW